MTLYAFNGHRRFLSPTVVTVITYNLLKIPHSNIILMRLWQNRNTPRQIKSIFIVIYKILK